MGQQGLHLAIGHGAMFQVEPDTVKAEMGRMVDVSRDEVSQGTHADWLLGSHTGQRFTCSQGVTFRDEGLSGPSRYRLD